MTELLACESVVLPLTCEQNSNVKPEFSALAENGSLAKSEFKALAAELLKTLEPQVLSELVLLATPKSKIPWISTVKGFFIMLSHDTFNSWMSALYGFMDEFEQYGFVHRVSGWAEVPKDRMAYFYENQNCKLYIDVSTNTDPEVNAKMFLFFNKYIPLFINIDGTDGLPERAPDHELEKRPSTPLAVVLSPEQGKKLTL